MLLSAMIDILGVQEKTIKNEIQRVLKIKNQKEEANKKLLLFIQGDF